MKQATGLVSSRKGYSLITKTQIKYNTMEKSIDLTEKSCRSLGKKKTVAEKDKKKKKKKDKKKNKNKADKIKTKRKLEEIEKERNDSSTPSKDCNEDQGRGGDVTNDDHISSTKRKEEDAKDKGDRRRKESKNKRKHSKKRKHKDSPKDDSSTTKKSKKEDSAKEIDPPNTDATIVGGPIISSSATEFLSHFNEPSCEKTNNFEKGDGDNEDIDGITLLLFYQYIDPVWTESMFQAALKFVETIGIQYSITGRMRVAYEGLNCTLTGTFMNVRKWCKTLREFENGVYFNKTEFKLTDHLPKNQCFPKLHAFKVDELVNYGLAGKRAPNISMTGTHLEPEDYHKKMTEDDAVIIDVRNHYEAAIGQFTPPENGAKYIDPEMRKSTEFPVWLDKPETKQMLKGKQVLMYCTGGVRCERASALLRTKMEEEEDVKQLGIKGVYQLQGGIDKYFKKFPEGGWWKGKNYVFDKRFAHAPPLIEARERSMHAEMKKRKVEDKEGENASTSGEILEVSIMGKCESCQKPWDKYRGKRRCPTCGVPSLICKECLDVHNQAPKNSDKSIRCQLCVKEGIVSKRQIKLREEREMKEYERKLREKESNKILTDSFDLSPGNHLRKNKDEKPAPNPEKITRLVIKNMCVKKMDQNAISNAVKGITHIQWLKDKVTGKFYGTAFVEMASPEDAARAVGMINGKTFFGRDIVVRYAKPDPKNVWPIPSTKI